MTDETERMSTTFEVIAKDTDGTEIQRDVIESTGTLTICDLKQNAVLNGLDELKIIPLTIEVKKGDKVLQSIEKDD